MEDFLTDTRRSYDRTAEDFATWIAGELATKPLDRALLKTFAELVRPPVADVGCGTGRITAYLNDLGVEAFGTDLSPAMIEVARRTHPTLHFEEGSMLTLEVADRALGGIVAWYSTIHIPDTHLPAVFSEFHRALTPGGYVQLAFQAGEGTEHRTKAGAHDVTLTVHHRQPQWMATRLEAANLEVVATVVRDPDREGDYQEAEPQAYVLARKPE